MKHKNPQHKSPILDKTERKLQSIFDESIKNDPLTPIIVDFQCQSGDNSDCREYIPEDSLSANCNGILMFSNTASSCGSNCENNNDSQEIIRKGWTLFTRY